MTYFLIGLEDIMLIYCNIFQMAFNLKVLHFMAMSR